MTRMLAKQRGHRGLGFPKLGAGKEARGGETLGRWVEGSVDWGFPTTVNSARPGGVPKPDQRSQHRESKVFGHRCHPRSGRARGEGGKKTSFTSERGCPEAAFVLMERFVLSASQQNTSTPVDTCVALGQHCCKQSHTRIIHAPKHDSEKWCAEGTPSPAV